MLKIFHSKNQKAKRDATKEPKNTPKKWMHKAHAQKATHALCFLEVITHLL
jgi:hypothetical protein